MIGWKEGEGGDEGESCSSDGMWIKGEDRGDEKM